ncbi:hypothetical protein DUNSADRAFT_5334, partial [Dunaliella salina]
PTPTHEPPRAPSTTAHARPAGPPSSSTWNAPSPSSQASHACRPRQQAIACVQDEAMSVQLDLKCPLPLLLSCLLFCKLRQHATACIWDEAMRRDVICAHIFWRHCEIALVFYARELAS